MNLAGAYDVIRYTCRHCGKGVITAVVVSMTRIGITGDCEPCQHSETAWFDLLEVDRFLNGGASPVAYSSPVGGQHLESDYPSPPKQQLLAAGCNRNLYYSTNNPITNSGIHWAMIIPAEI